MLSNCEYSDMCTLVSMKPGTSHFPLPSITRAFGGIVTAPRFPTMVILLPVTTTTASGTAAPPLPSTSVAPTMAVTATGACAWAGDAYHASSAHNAGAKKARAATCLAAFAEKRRVNTLSGLMTVARTGKRFVAEATGDMGPRSVPESLTTPRDGHMY